MTRQAMTMAGGPLWRERLRLLAGSLRDGWALFSRNKIGLAGLGVILAFALMAAAHPVLMHTVWDPATYDPVTGHALDVARHPASPSAEHLLGTDPRGRDILSQLMWSARWEFALGMLAALVTLLAGTLVGAVAAYFPGVIDALLMRLADLVVMMPAFSLLVVLGVVAPGGLNMIKLALVIGLLTGFGATAIIIKAQALGLTSRSYIEAARVAGCSHARIILVHLAPNLLPLALLSMMVTVTVAVFSEAALSYFGVLDIRMSWGIMIHTAQVGGYLLSGTDYWWLLVPSGLAVTLLCGSFYLVGRALYEVVNPRLRRR